jgi:Domain of unknown function (DUF5047)
MSTKLYPVSSTYLKAATAGSQIVACKLEVYHGTELLATLMQNVTKANVKVDSTATARRQLTAQLQSQGWPLDELVPRKPGDLLHPDSGNVIRAYRGFKYPNGKFEYAPCGLFLPTPKVQDTDASILITLTATDRSITFIERKWYKPFKIKHNTPLHIAIEMILRSRTADITLGLIEGSTFKVGPITVGVTPYNTTTTTPWVLALQLAATGGMELYFNSDGLPVLAPIPTPLDQEVQLIIEAGPDSVLNKTLTRTLSRKNQYNGVIGIGTGPGGTPIRIEKWTTNPRSPTFAGPTDSRGWGHVPYFLKTDLVPAKGESQEHAKATLQSMVNAAFRLVVNAFDVPSFFMVTNAALQEGNCIGIKRPRLGLDKNYVVTGMTIPLYPMTVPMQVTARGPQLATVVET